MKKTLLVLTASILILVSCNKDSSSNLCTLSTANISGTYKMTSFLYKADATTPELDLFPSLDACQKDDLFTFNNDGTYVVSEGATSCNPTNADNGTWSLSGTTLTIGGEPSEVLNYSCSGFKARLTSTSGEVTTITFAKQ